MCADNEMAVYLEKIIEHERTCEVANCSLCQSAQNLYQLVRKRIFSEVVYSEVTIAARGLALEAKNRPDRAKTVSLPHAA